MDQAKDSTTTTTTHKNRHQAWRKLHGFSRFLGCFGGVLENKLPKKQETKSMAKSQRLSLSRMKLGKMPRRTVPVDANNTTEKSHKKKSSKKHSFSDQLIGKEEEHGRIPAPVKVSHEKTIKWLGCVRWRWKNNIERINNEKRESNKKKDPQKMMKINTLCKQEAINFTSSLNPQMHNYATSSNAATVIMTSRSASTSLRDVCKHSVHTVNEVLQEKSDAGFDQVLIGMLIMTIILIIMIIWGKLYAILCTSALCYVYPFLSTKIEQNVVGLNIISEENKKVVLMK